MNGNENDTRRTLEQVLKYLEDRYADQLAGLRDVDSRIKIRLTVLGGFLGAVIVTIRALEDAGLFFLLGAVVIVLAFACCYARTLWLALSVIEMRLGVPGVEAGSYQTMARYGEQLASLPHLRELVINYADAIEENWQIIEDRKGPGTNLHWWMKATLVASFVTVSYFGIVYGVSVYARSTAEVPVANEATKPEPANEAPANQSPQPSGLAKPQHIELGRGRVVTMNCDVPFQSLPQEAHARFLSEIRTRVNAEFPDLYVRPRMVGAGENDEVTVVTPAPAVAPGAAPAVMSMDEVARRSQIKDRVTEIREQLLRELEGSPSDSE